MSKKVVDVSISVTCLEEDADNVVKFLRVWFQNSPIELVARPGGYIKRSDPKPIRPWMKEVLTPEDC